MNEKITKKEIVAFALIVVAMIGCLVYGFFLLKENQKPTPTPLPIHTNISCWDYYESQGEEVAIRMCEGVGEGE